MVHLLNVPKPLPHLGVAPLCPQSPLLVLALVMCGLMLVLLHPLLPLCLTQPAAQVPPGPPASCAAPLLVGPVVDSVADELRALELLSSFMDPPEVEALRSRLVPSPAPVPSEPVLNSHRALAQELADKCKRQEKLQTQLSEQRVKVAEEERVLERMQADLVGLVGEASDLDEEILELRRKVSVVPEPEDMDGSDGSTPRAVMRKKSKVRAPKEKKVKILTDSSTKILKLAQGLSHGDLLKLAKRLEMALDSGSNAASSKDIETNFQNVEDEEDGELSMTYG